MDLKKKSEGVWEFREKDMNVPARIYANKRILDSIEEGVYTQISNVARLPGVIDHVCVMPDGHFGYGFPIGGVAAFDVEEGVVSPGGVGYDINCGVRLLASNMEASDVKPKIKDLIDLLFDNVPSGLGSKSRLRISDEDLETVCMSGAEWVVEEGFGLQEDLERTEESGRIPGADFSKVGKRAIQRGRPQLGTLGSGNHFLEVQEVQKIYDPDVAKKFGITHEGQVTVMVHCGSRGLGYQVADDYIKVMLSAAKEQGINLPDLQLACAKIPSEPAMDYIGAMYCAVNYAFANRQYITHWVRESFEKLFPKSQLNQVYDVCHNIAKFEDHEEYGRICVHRKGATRAFGPGREELPEVYRDVGQPVIVPGDMGTASYLLVGTDAAMKESFGSVCHGAGRLMSRAKASNTTRGEDVERELRAKGEYVKAASMKVLAEEHSGAYKNIDEVIKSVELSGLSRPIAKMVPLGVAKG
ncbi:MAG TPA: RtcB family protein [Candidatus Altiarchaeales archaeon]|nr:RtcB family protein [Candidatus Altiarchaeales archaeon]